VDFSSPIHVLSTALDDKCNPLHVSSDLGFHFFDQRFELRLDSFG
jgi:hypothetical protein